ncbi:MAG: hypothetical protein K6G38_06385 [Gammaproteobacteria bacterium]|nr:hypothetical protein [Gammaproteobacteria bacterium]
MDINQHEIHLIMNPKQALLEREQEYRKLMSKKPTTNSEMAHEIFDQLETNFIQKYFDGQCERYYEFQKEVRKNVQD